jgi:hypothetical protein
MIIIMGHLSNKKAQAVGKEMARKDIVFLAWRRL